MKRYLIFSLFLSSLIALMLLWFGKLRMDEFTRYHLSIANNASSGVAEEIGRFVREKERLVSIFAAEHMDLIKNLLQHPDDDSVAEKFRGKLQEYFPNHFTFTLANTNGLPHLQDFDGLIGEQCQADLKTYAQEHIQSPNIHPHPELYHFDVMTMFDTGSQQGILFVSFDANMLGAILGSAEAPGHEMLLLNPGRQMLIEASSAGARNQVFREDYRLNQLETERILHSTSVANTDWLVSDLYQPVLFSSYRWQIIQQSLFIFLVYLFFIAFLLGRARYVESLRQSTEQHKNEFLSIVSHELRTPLTSIKGALSLVLNAKTGDISEQTRNFLNIAMNNSERLGYLVDDLLDVQKIEAGVMEFNMTSTDVAYLVESCVNSQRTYASQYNSNLSIVNNLIYKHAILDKQRMSQAIINLISNAIKYGKENDDITILLSNIGRKTRINITNHGNMIAESDRNRIFEKFVQIDSSATRKVGGTGLGLSIVRLIVEKHHGIVDFESSPEATTFFIEIPASI